jgi:hypothetical protein
MSEPIIDEWLSAGAMVPVELGTVGVLLMEVARLRADNAAQAGIIANLNERSAQYERDNAVQAARIAGLEKHVTQLQAKLHCMCGSEMNHSAWEGHSAISMYDYALDDATTRAEKAEAERDEAYRLRDAHHTENINLRLEAEEWRAERDEAKAALASMTDDYFRRHQDAADNFERAAIAETAANARIAEMKTEHMAAHRVSLDAIRHIECLLAGRDRRIVALRRALTPFALAADILDAEGQAHHEDDYEIGVTLGSCRQARAALQDKPE